MTQFVVDVNVTPRTGILDPQGNAVLGALRALEFSAIREVKIGRLIRLTVEAKDETEARTVATTMCDKLLANPVTEDYTLTVRRANG